MSTIEYINARGTLTAIDSPTGEPPQHECEARTPIGLIVRRIPLFVIKKKGQDQYWTCSSEHGSGWHDKHPKQSFTKSELTKELFRLIDLGWFTDLEILQLHVHKD